jgi:hypothetical protein
VFALTLGVVGCTPDYPKIARETFSKDRSCPLPGVVATPRPDLSWYDLAYKPKPTPEIAADPARLRAWESDEAKSRSVANARMQMHLVTGCNEKHYYYCSRARNGPFCGQMDNPVP